MSRSAPTVPIHRKPETPRRRVGSQATSGSSSGAASKASNLRQTLRLISQDTKCAPESPSYRVWSKSNTTSGRYGSGVSACGLGWACVRSEEHTSELQSLMRISYAVFCLKKKKNENEQS